MPVFEHAGISVGVSPNGITVEADSAATYDWAHRSGSVWPCSALSDHHIWAQFDRNGLVDLLFDNDHHADENPDSEYWNLGGDELSAFCADAIRAHIDEHHPCWFITVGQFE